MTNRLKEVMTEKKISIDDLSVIANVTNATICNWRRKKVDEIKPKTRGKIAKYLKMDVNDIFKI